MIQKDDQLQKIKHTLGSDLLKIEFDTVGVPVLWIKADSVVRVLEMLKQDMQWRYDFLRDLTCYDDLGASDAKEGRFVVVYNLLSHLSKDSLRVKVRIADGEKALSVVGLWKAANWAEREVYDMYGVEFDGHPDLRRILMDHRFEGHPQRKDYYWRQYQLFLDAEPMPENLLKE